MDGLLETASVQWENVLVSADLMSAFDFGFGSY